MDQTAVRLGKNRIARLLQVGTHSNGRSVYRSYVRRKGMQSSKARPNGPACADSLPGLKRKNTSCTYGYSCRNIVATRCAPTVRADDFVRKRAMCSVGSKTLPDVVRLSIKDASDFFDSLELPTEEAAIADRVLHEIRRRLRFLVDVGLDYLTLDRLASTLSGGEAQRIQIGYQSRFLFGRGALCSGRTIDRACTRATARGLSTASLLRDIGNTVLVVEHDAEMMRAADHVLDIGPAAGELGGHVIFEGTYQDLLKDQSFAHGALFARRS